MICCLQLLLSLHIAHCHLCTFSINSAIADVIEILFHIVIFDVIKKPSYCVIEYSSNEHYNSGNHFRNMKMIKFPHFTLIFKTTLYN